jgi:hypothetical protein
VSSKAVYGPGTTDRVQDRTEIDKGRTAPSAPIELTKEQFERFNDYADKAAANPPDYFALGKNCVRFTLDRMKQAGIDDRDLVSKFTPEQLKDTGAAGDMFVRAVNGFGNGKVDFPEDDWASGGRSSQPPESTPTQGDGAPASPPADGSASGGLAAEAQQTASAEVPQEQKVSNPDPAPAPAPTPTPTPTPEIQAMREQMAAPVDDPAKAALLKPVENWTQGEMSAALGGAMDRRSGDPLRYRLYDQVGAWHDHVYGDGPQQFDDTCRPVEPQPVRPVADTEVALSTPDGGDLGQGMDRVAGHVEAASQADGFPLAVKGLQRGLNMLAGVDRPPPPGSDIRHPLPEPITVDGEYGPETDYALKSAMAAHGPTAVEDALALGRWNSFARQAQADGDPSGLADSTHGAFGPLFRPQGQGPRPEGEELQRMLNDYGPRHFDDWETLTPDGWIGPKTTEAFGRMLQAEDADQLTRGLGQRLGLG